MQDIDSALEPLKQDVSIASCARCGRGAELSRHGREYWCGWCGAEAGIELKRLRVIGEDTLRAHTVDGQVVDPEHVPLQPLRITSGWKVIYNNALYAVDPTPETVKWWWIFKQDMLTLVHEDRRRLLDVGWTPEMAFDEGCYRLLLHEGDFAGPELARFETRDRRALVGEIERLLEAVTNGAL